MTAAGPSSTSSAGPPTNSMALISLIAGILGLTFFPFLGSIAAVITGNMAKKELAANPGVQGGEGMAQAGVILGWIGVGLGIIGICIACVAILFPLIMVGSIEGFSLAALGLLV